MKCIINFSCASYRSLGKPMCVLVALSNSVFTMCMYYSSLMQSGNVLSCIPPAADESSSEFSTKDTQYGFQTSSSRVARPYQFDFMLLKQKCPANEVGRLV